MDIKLDIYNEECLSLAKSMYLKFDLHALAVERWYRGSTVVSDDKTTWLQYMNLAGMYHEYNDPMTIKSLDTFEDIEFTKETLKDHPTTYTLYKEFGSYYDTLIAKYPKNDVLIRGILYNKSIEEIIDMEDFHIVGWNENLIDIQEYDLISQLNQHLTIEGTAAGSPNYIECNLHYPSIILGYVVSNLPVKIKRIRFENSKKYSANTFYIWSHINSVINLEDYKSILTYDDIMYLFKNIKRLKSGRCSKDIFLELLNEIIHPKMIDTYRLESNTHVNTMNIDDHYVEAKWEQKDILGTDVKEIAQATLIQDHKSRSRYLNENAESDLVESLFTEYNTNTYGEITLYDNRETEGDVRDTMIFVDYAFLYSGTGLLDRYYEIAMPDTGELINLQHSDWMTIYQRIQQIRYGEKSEFIPPHDTFQMYRYTPISRTDLIDNGLSAESANRILELIGIYPVLRNDTAETYAYSENFNITRGLVESIITRSIDKTNNIYIGNVCDIIFGSYRIALHDEKTSFINWLDSSGVDVDTMSEDTLIQLEYNILTNVVGISGDSAETLVNTLGSMLQKFVSYKTNISRKMSDIITIPLSTRPKWIELGDDMADLAEYLHIKTNIKSTVLSELGGDAELGSSTIIGVPDNPTLNPMLDLGGHSVIFDSENTEVLINRKPLTIEAEILEINQ